MFEVFLTAKRQPKKKDNCPKIAIFVAKFHPFIICKLPHPVCEISFIHSHS